MFILHVVIFFYITSKDVERLVKKFKTSTVGIDKFFGWNHVDFLMGREVNTVNRKILNVMQLYNIIPNEEVDY